MSSISGRTPLDTGESTVLLDMEELALPYMIGNVTSDPQLARAVMRGGASGPGNLGSSTLWNTDKSGGMASLYANAFIIQPGNTNVLPRTDSGAAYTLRSAMCPVPMGYNPTLDGSMASVPYATKTIVETNVLRSNTVNGFTFGYQSTATADLFSAANGCLGFCVYAAGGSGSLSAVALRGNGANNGQTTLVTLPLATAVPFTAGYVNLRWEITVGRTWVARLFIGGAEVMAINPAQFAYQNLNICTNDQFHAFPTMAIGRGIGGPLRSRFRILRVTA